MAIWNNNTCNSHREFYKQYGTTPLNAQGVNHLNPFENCILSNGVNIAGSIFQIIAQNVDSDGSSSSSSSSSGEAEVIKEHIDEILDKYNVATIDDLEALGEVQEIYNKGQEENIKLERAIGDYNTIINECDKNIATNNSNILNYKNEITELKSGETFNGNNNSIKIKELEAGIANAEKAIEDAEKKQKDAETNKNNAEAKIEKNSKLENPNLDLAGLEKDIQDLKTYMKQLKKAESKDAIEEWVNEDTGNIVDLIDKYGRNPENKRVKEKLKEALEEYFSDGSMENKNKSIVSYAKFKADELGLASNLF